MLELYCRLASWLRREEGQGMVEYALVLLAIAGAVAIAAGLLGDSIGRLVNDVIAGVEALPGGGP